MPNYVTNKITIIHHSESNDHIIKSCLDENGSFDFDRIIPIDKKFKGFNPSHEIIVRAKNAMGIALNPSISSICSLEKDRRIEACFTSARKEDIDGIIKAIELFKKTGCFYWREARLSKWGTEHNAFNTRISNRNNKIFFDTAWSHPRPIYIELSKKNPCTLFKIEYASEDLGYNCGKIFIENGKIFNEKLASRKQSKEARKKWMKFAIKLVYPNTPLCKLGLNENYERIEV